jgi:hypothetical protein
MNNLQSSAFPLDFPSKEYAPDEKGFTKLEYASLLIAQGLASDSNSDLTDFLAKLSVSFAKAVLEEANK